MFININPEKGKVEGNYFGICVDDGYDWHQCYSYAWEVINYWDTDKNKMPLHAVKCFPDADWAENEVGIVHQLLAINQGYAEKPESRFFVEEVIVDKTI